MAMTSDQHAATATADADRGLSADYGNHEHRMRLLASAQVHAQLAVATAIRETAADVIATLRERS